MSSRLDGLPIVEATNSTDGTRARMPGMMLFGNIPIQWEFLALVVQDWDQACNPFQQQLDEADSDEEKLFLVSKAFLKLQTPFLKCLFSYAFFFIALVEAYHELYSELNDLNQKTRLHLKHQTIPDRSDQLVRKVARIRNLSVAHQGLSDSGNMRRRANPADRVSAQLWRPMSISMVSGVPWDLNQLTFGGFTLAVRDKQGATTKSGDLEIPGIHHLNAQCLNFLTTCDDVCASYLESICQLLPTEVNGTTFRAFAAH